LREWKNLITFKLAQRKYLVPMFLQTLASANVGQIYDEIALDNLASDFFD
jgi:hypothetical protein